MEKPITVSSRRAFDRLAGFASAHEALLIGMLVALVVVAGAGYSLWLGGTLRFADEVRYHTLAQSLTHGRFSLDGVHPNASRPMGYPLFLAAFVRLGAGVVVLRWLNFLALAGCIVLTWRMVKRQHGALAGLVGAAFVVAYPVLFFTAGTLYPQSLSALLLLLALELVLGEPVTLPARAVLAGVCFGVLLLMVPSFAFSLLIVVAWLLFGKRADGMRSAAALVLVAVLIVTPWAVRNQRVFGTPIFGSANSGYMLLMGNSENTTPNAGPNADVSRYRDQTMHMNDVERDAYFQQQALAYIAAHPVRTARMYVLKTANYFNYRNDLATRSESSRLRDLLMLLTYGPLLALFGWRLLRWRTHPLSALEALLVTLYLLQAPYAAIFFTRVRYRLPFDHLLIIVVAGLVAGTAAARERERYF